MASFFRERTSSYYLLSLDLFIRPTLEAIGSALCRCMLSTKVFRSAVLLAITQFGTDKISAGDENPGTVLDASLIVEVLSTLTFKHGLRDRPHQAQIAEKVLIADIWSPHRKDIPPRHLLEMFVDFAACWPYKGRFGREPYVLDLLMRFRAIF